MLMFDFMKEIVDKQVASYQEGHLRHFMDVYVKEIKESEISGEDTGFKYEQLVMMCTDFLFPTLSAIESRVTFLLRFLLKKQNVMKKIQDEIEHVVGTGRLPELDDRIK